MSKFRKGGFIIFCVIIVLAVVFAAYTVLQILSDKKINRELKGQDITENTRSLGKSFIDFDLFQNDYVAKIYIEGVITDETKEYNQKWLLQTITELEADKNNRGILLYLNTPGGGVYQADELYLALLHYKHMTGRSIYAYMGPMAASAGYYLACSADKIMANRNTLTGSIGVIFGSALDATELMEKIGIKSTTFHSGKNKNMLNLNEPVTDEHRAIMQSVADEAYQQFVGIVAESRGMEVAQVKKLADGRVYTARQAQENGLIDVICSEIQAEGKICSDTADGKMPKIKDFRYERKMGFADILTGSLSKVLKDGLKGAVESAATESQVPYLSYYYSH